MNKNILFYILVYITWIPSAIVLAEIAYVTDEVNIGLHKEPTNKSPIIKLVPSGTELNIIERENDLIHVEEPEGVRGWINTQNVLNNKPGKTKINELEITNKELQKQIKTLKKKSTKLISQEELEQKLNSERLKVGELKVKLTNLKSGAGNIQTSDKLLADIEQLKSINKQLIDQFESTGINHENSPNSIKPQKELLSFFIFLIIFIFGIAGGILILDYINRRRHGGFRV
jgi:SH3 domain protein